LFGIGLCGLLAILSTNFAVLPLASLPLYALLLGGPEGRRRFWALAAPVGLCYLAYVLGYTHFAGAKAATNLNKQIFSPPGPSYLLHLAYGSILSPFFYLFWGHFHFPVWAYALAVATLVSSVALVLWAGGSRDRRLALWILLLNILPFLLASLARYKKAPEQAFVLLLIGTAWNLLSRRLPARSWVRILLPLGFLALLAHGQLAGVPVWRAKYLEYGRHAQDFYRELGKGDAGTFLPPGDKGRDFLPWDSRDLTRPQALAIRRFVQREFQGGGGGP
jgi:hypothetical protein